MEKLSKICFFILFYFCLPLLIDGGSDFDPYEVLAVSQTSSPDEIKKAYRKQAREWHPDKNKSPEAQDRFIQIQQSYEILSDNDKRHQYDTGGFSKDAMHTSGWKNFNFRDFGDIFNGQNFGSSRDASVWDFNNKILPESFSTPQLLYVYSTFCGRCVVWLRTTWKKSAEEIKKLGVNAVSIDATFASPIVSKLAITQVPSIVGIYRGRYYYYKDESSITYNGLKNFVNSFLPKNILTINSGNFESFLGGIEEDDKPRAILFSPSMAPTLLYTLLSVKHSQHIKFGFVTLGIPSTQNISDTFGATGSRPTLLMFKKDKRNPAVVLKSSEMYHGAIDQLLESNKYMTVPRITSENVFDEICPPPSKDGSDVFTLCTLLITDPEDAESLVILENLRHNAPNVFTESTAEWISLMHVHASEQPAFVEGLSKDWKNNRGLILMWRSRAKKASITTWPVSALAVTQSSDVALKQERELNKFLQFALKVSRLQEFDRDVDIKPIVNILAGHPAVEFIQDILTYITDTIEDFKRLNTRKMMMYFLGAGLVIYIIGGLFSGDELENPVTNRDEDDIIMDEINQQQQEQQPQNKERPDKQKQEEKNMTPKTQAKEPSDEITVTVPQSKTSRGVFDLPEKYESVILRQPKGKLCVVLLSDQSSASHREYFDMYQEAMKLHMRDPKMNISWLNVDQYMSWFTELRRSSSAQPLDDAASTYNDDEISSLHGEHSATDHSFREQEFVEGTVLVLNGAKHWYCIFVPRGIDVNQTSKTEEGDSNASHQQSYSESLITWVERVVEGQNPRLYIRQWPGLYMHQKEWR